MFTHNNKEIQFDEGTPEVVKQILVRELHSGNRLRLYFGDKETGKDWNEENDIMGYIGISTGWKPILILLNNNRSMGGPAILTACILKITKNGYKLWEHPHYHTSKHTTGMPKNEDYQDAAYTVKEDGSLELVAQFKRKGQAQKWIDFIEGRRDSKS